MIVPTLHVLFIRKHPLDILSALKDPIRPHVREELLDWIADEALGGDRDAAEWVLLACVARVYVSSNVSTLQQLTPSPLANLALIHSTRRP
jgi:hypothetical protein